MKKINRRHQKGMNRFLSYLLILAMIFPILFSGPAVATEIKVDFGEGIETQEDQEEQEEQEEQEDDIWDIKDFTYEGTIITELSESGKEESVDPLHFASDDFRKLIVISLNIEENRVSDMEWINKDVETYSPTKDDMRKLRKIDHIDGILTLDLTNLSSLKGIEYAENLEEIKISFASLSDISSLRGLSKLKYLNLSWCKIADISSLKDLTRIERLILSDNDIEDISALGNMNNLFNLSLEGNKIKDISYMDNLNKLTNVGLRGNQIKDVSGLKNLTKIVELDLSENNISDINSLENLVNLTNLNISENKIQDISALKGLTSLTELDVIGNLIGDLNPLSDLINLETLSIRNNKVKDITPLKSLVNLTCLHIYENQIEDISAIKELRNLEEFNFSKNKVKDLSPIAGFENLNILFGYQNKVEDVTPVITLTNCYIVNLSQNSVIDVSPLKEFSDGSRNIVVDKEYRRIEVKDAKIEEGDNIIFTIENPIKVISGDYGNIDITKENGTIIKSHNNTSENNVLKITIPKKNFNFGRENVVILDFLYEKMMKAMIWDEDTDNIVEVGYDFSGKIDFVFVDSVAPIDPVSPVEPERSGKSEVSEIPSKQKEAGKTKKLENHSKLEKINKLEDLKESNKSIEEITFIDLNKAPWAKEAIEYLAIKKIILGFGNNEFRPNDKLTRSQFASILVRAFNLEVVTGDAKFYDVKQGDWYYESVMNLANMNIIAGDGIGNFNPNENITREQMVKMLMQAISIKYPEHVNVKGDLTNFKDNSTVSDWAMEYMEQAIGLNLISGFEDLTIGPKEDTSRGEAVVLIYRVLDLIE